jgi:hypothetical protein
MTQQSLGSAHRFGLQSIRNHQRIKPMSTAAGNSANLPQSTASEIDNQVQSALGAGDTGSTQAMQNLTLIHQARVSQLTRIAATLKKQYGADDPKTKAAEAAVHAGTARTASMTAIHLQAATPSPQISANGWAVHGRVFNAQLQPAANFTVFLVDDTKQFQSQFRFSYSDSTGYFLLNNRGTKDKTQANGQLFPEIANKKKQPVYLSITEFSPVPGSATYQNIVLPAGEKPLGDPPEEIQGGAIPNPRKKR